MRYLSKNQSGFTLVNAIFILVVLAALGAFMVTMTGVQSRTPIFAVQGARAYQAAQTGIEWGIAQSVAGSCAVSTTITVEGFSVTVGCSAQSIIEGPMSYYVYDLTSQASTGSYGSAGYVSRRVDARVTGP